MLDIIIALLAIAIVLLCVYVRRKQHFWQDKGVDVPTYIPFLGHIHKLFFSAHRWKYLDQLYYRFKEQKVWGMYEMWKPVLFVADREIARAMLVKDADHFTDRRDMYINRTKSEADQLMAEMLFHKRGDEWKHLRSIMSPVFTSGKMKAMFPSIRSEGDKLVAFLEQQQAKNGHVVMDVAVGRYMLAVIASCAFGLTVPITEEASVFELKVKNLLSLNTGVLFRLVVLVLTPGWLLNLLGLEMSDKNVYFFNDIMKQTMRERKEKGIRREDFLDLMQDALKENQQSDNPKYDMTERTVIAQAVLFVFGGFDTSTSALSLTTYLLAKNQHVQDKLRQELRNMCEGSEEFSYENIAEAHYLDACFNESLRLYGPGHALERQCSRQYSVPGMDLTLQKGMIVSFPNWSFEHDPELWEDPEEFKPERFMPENKESVTPYSHMPFGVGPRNCIALRFAQMEAKIAIAKLVLNHRLTLPIGREELILDDESMAMKATKHGIHIHFEAI